MKPRIALFAAMLFAAVSLYAGCGSSSCPLDLNHLNVPAARHFSLDLSLQYIDQDQPRAGSRNPWKSEKSKRITMKCAR